MIEFGEWLPDLSDYDNPGATEISGVYPALRSYRPIKALTAVSGNALTSRCLGTFSMKDKNGDSHVFAGDAAKLYNRVADTLTDQSKSGGYVTQSDQRWRFASFGDYVIATNAYDALQKFDVSGSGPFEDLGGSPPKARFLAVVRDFLVLGVIDGDGLRVRWCAINDPEAWTVGTDQSDFQDLPDGGPITGLAGGEYGLIFQERKITRMSYVGSPLIFQFDPIEENHGCVEPNSIVQYGRYVAYLSHNGFYMTDGASTKPIGDQKIDKTFFDDLVRQYMYNMTAAVDPVNKLFVWAYPGAGSSGGEPNKMLIYNWALDRWSSASINVEILFTSLTRGTTLEELDAIGNLDALTESLDSQRWKGGELHLAGFNPTHYLATFSGSNIAATMETTEAEPVPGTKTRARFARPIVDATNATVQIGHRARLADSVTWTSAATVDSRGRCAVRVYDRYLRARVSVPAAATWTHAQGIEFVPIAGGGR